MKMTKVVVALFAVASLAFSAMANDPSAPAGGAAPAGEKKEEPVKEAAKHKPTPKGGDKKKGN